MTLGQTIRRMREEAGMSQDVLASRLGVDQATVSRWETGQQRPSGDSLAVMVREVFPGQASALLAAAAQKP